MKSAIAGKFGLSVWKSIAFALVSAYGAFAPSASGARNDQVEQCVQPGRGLG